MLSLSPPACQMLLNDKMDATAWPWSHSVVLQSYDNRNVNLGKKGPTVHCLQACGSYESHLMTRMTCLASVCFAPKILMVVWQKCRNSTEAAMWNNEIYLSLFLGEASTEGGWDDDDTTDSWFYNVEWNFSKKDWVIVRFGFAEKHIRQLMVKTLKTNSEISNILYYCTGWQTWSVWILCLSVALSRLKWYFWIVYLTKCNKQG